MFDLGFSTWLGLGGIGTFGLMGLAAYFLGARAVVEALAPLLKGAAEGLVALSKALWAGFQGLIDTVSDLMMVVLIVAATWFGTSMHYKMEIKDLNFVHKQQTAKCKVPTSVLPEGRYWPFNW